MKIKQVRVRNYKSWKDSGPIAFSSGLNVIVGQNNTGKTALLEALSLAVGSHPHVTIESKPEVDSLVNPQSSFTVNFSFSEGEIDRAIPKLQYDYYIPITRGAASAQAALMIAREQLKLEREIEATVSNNSVTSSDFNPGWLRSDSRFFHCRSNIESRTIELHDEQFYGQPQVLGGQKFTNLLSEVFRKQIYLLKAERYNTTQTNIDNGPELLSQDCSNLAKVLHALHSDNPQRFNRIIELLKKVFPRVKGITIPVNGAIAQVVVWPVELATERKDLAIQASESGTGVIQVLAMLFLIVYSNTPQCILIDEPQSFLHPGAIRALMEIFRGHDRHQYVITTHSPYVLSLPSLNIIHVTHDGNESIARTIDGAQTNEARLVLHDIGFKLSDVFGADKILWVEGATEEECFKLIARAQTNVLLNLEIFGVKNTGDLQGKQAEAVYDIYTKLSEGIGILPAAVGFILDREMRTEQEQDDLRRKSDQRIHFLPRRMFENYLLDVDAISILLSKISGSLEYTSLFVSEWIKKNGLSSEYIKIKNVIPFDERWLLEVHGARLISELFSKSSRGTIHYDKVKHGYQLTESILKRCPQAFDDITKLLLAL